MSAAVNTLAHAACALVLAASFLAHLLRPRLLARALAVHGLLPPWAWWPVAAAVIALEGAAAGLLAWTSLAAGPRADLVVGAGAAALFAGYALYLARVLRTAPAAAGTSCGCGLGDSPVGGWTIARASVLAAAATAGGLWGGAVPLMARPVAEVVVLVCAAVTFAVTVGLLPAARALPGGPPVPEVVTR